MSHLLAPTELTTISASQASDEGRASDRERVWASPHLMDHLG